MTCISILMCASNTLGRGLCAAISIIALASNVSAETAANFHHVHLNVVNPESTIAYYKKFFSGVPVKFRGVSDAVFVDRSFILLNKVETPASSAQQTGIAHIGWFGVDGPGEFEWRDEEGIEWQRELSPLGDEYFMYAYGPDKEIVEVYTGPRHNRFGHVHLVSDDVAATTKWFMGHLGLDGPGKLPPRPALFDQGPGLMDYAKILLWDRAHLLNFLWQSEVKTTNDVIFNIFHTPVPGTFNWAGGEPMRELKKTDGHVIDHIAFSYRDIDAVFARMKAAGVEIVEPITYEETLRMRHFFIRSPDKVLVEIVEAKPIPSGVWGE